MHVRISTQAADVAKADNASAHRERVYAAGEEQALFAALDDPDCRRILGTISDEALSVKEVADACDLSLSSAYRKLDLMSDGMLVEERVRMHTDGRHVSEYIRQVDNIVLDLNDGGNVQCVASLREADWSLVHD